MSQPVLGIIGGTGVYQFEGLTDIQRVEVDTPFGKTSDPIVVGTCHGLRCAFLARHGTGHRLLPTEVPFKANIWALKSLGVMYILSVSACGSLKEEYKPMDLVMVDQFIDRTKNRDAPFFGDGVVCHVSFGDPTCALLRELVAKSIKSVLPSVTLHPRGTYICMEGPAFSTRAESLMYQQWGGQIIGMTAVTESKLAREAEMAYACVGLVTDYDAWRPHEESVTADAVMKILKANGDNVQIFVKAVIKDLAQAHPLKCPDHNALQFSLITDLKVISEARKKQLMPLIAKYLK